MDQHWLADHNAMVAQLWDDYGRATNARAPITLAADEALWLSLTDHNFREFYTDPRVQLEVTLQGHAWMAHHLVHDQRLGDPEQWTVSPRFWMDEPEYFGCEVAIQDHSFAWAEVIPGSKADLLTRLADLDPATAVQRTRLWALYQGMSEVVQGITWRDRQVEVAAPGAGTHGLFTVACHLRGAERLCLDVMEDPDFVDRLLTRVTDLTIARIEAWHRLTGRELHLPLPAWGAPDDSLQLLSPATYRQAVLPHHQRLYAALTDGPRNMHLCGYSTQHYRTIYDDLGITALDGPGTFADHGRLLGEMPRLSISAQGDHTRLLVGPPGDIEAMMRDLMTTGACQPGRFTVMGFVVPETPPAHLTAMYEAGKRYGRTGA